MCGEPFIEEIRLWKTAWKTIEHPAAGLAAQPIGEDAAHEIVRQVSAALEDGLGEFSEF